MGQIYIDEGEIHVLGLLQSGYKVFFFQWVYFGWDVFLLVCNAFTAFKAKMERNLEERLDHYSFPFFLS